MHLEIHGLLDAWKDEEQNVSKEVVKAKESLKGDKEVLRIFIYESCNISKGKESYMHYHISTCRWSFVEKTFWYDEDQPESILCLKGKKNFQPIYSHCWKKITKTFARFGIELAYLKDGRVTSSQQQLSFVSQPSPLPVWVWTTPVVVCFTTPSTTGLSLNNSGQSCWHFSCCHSKVWLLRSWSGFDWWFSESALQALDTVSRN